MKYAALLLLLLTSSITLADTDSELNTIYKKALSNSSDSKSLIKSQRLWLKFIQQDCEATTYGLYCGQDPHQCKLIINECVTDYKKSRANYLKQFIH